MPRSPAGVARSTAPLMAAVAALSLGLAVVRPWEAAPVGFDTQATVLYFERLASGVRLEAPLTTTPKPLLTLVYGVLFSATGGWQAIVWATLLAHVIGALLVAVVASRAAGIVAGAVAGVVVAGSAVLLADTAVAGGIPWAVAGWAAAGVLVTGERRRYVLAGVALLVAALARIESLVPVVAAGTALAWARVGPLPAGLDRPSIPARAWAVVLLPFLAVPVMCIHDALLTGDPTYWLDVSVRYSQGLVASGATILDPVGRLRWLGGRYLPAWPLILLGAVGVGVLLRERRWVVLTGLAGLGPGIAAFLLVLAARGIYAPDRYAAPIDVSLAVAAAIGAATLAAFLVDRWAPGRFGPTRLAAVAGLTAALGPAALGIGPFDPAETQVIATLRAVNDHAGRVSPLLAELAGPPTVDGGPRWIVPTPVRPRLVVELGARLGEVGGLGAGRLEPDVDPFRPGQIVFHDRVGDAPAGAYAILESEFPVTLGDVVIDPALADSALGIWVGVVREVP